MQHSPSITHPYHVCNAAQHLQTCNSPLLPGAIKVWEGLAVHPKPVELVQPIMRHAAQSRVPVHQIALILQRAVLHGCIVGNRGVVSTSIMNRSAE